MVRADGPTADVVHGYLQMLEARAGTDLSTRAAHAGRGRLRVTGIEVFNEAGIVASGQPAIFRLQVEGPREPAQCLITIIDDLGDRLHPSIPPNIRSMTVTEMST